MEYPYLEQIRNNPYRGASVSLSFPIFNKLQIKTNVDRAKLGLDDSQFQLELAKQTLYRDIQKAHADASSALEKYYSAEEAVKSNEEAFFYTQEQFNIGMVGSVEFNEAKNNLTRARSELLQAKYEYIFNIKILEFFKGIPLRL